jgi:hypothetical protein
MPDYSLTSLITKAKARVYVRRMASSKLYEIVIDPRDKALTTIPDLSWYEAQQKLHEQRLLIALQTLNLTPSRITEYLKRLEEEYFQRTGKFEDDLKWLNNTVNLNLVTTRRAPYVPQRLRQ